MTKVYPEGVPVDVCELFESLAMEVGAVGYDHYSADAILHRIRWQFTIDQGDREFKCNNNWTSKLARWFMMRHPDRGEFFETRRSPLLAANDNERNAA